MVARGPQALRQGCARRPQAVPAGDERDCANLEQPGPATRGDAQHSTPTRIRSMHHLITVLQDFAHQHPNLLDHALKLLLCIASGIVIWRCGRALAARHGNDIRLLGFLFWFTVLLAFFIACWADRSGAIDQATGAAHTVTGKAILWLLGFALDLKGSMLFFGAVVAFAVLPQWLNYIAFSGPLGCASAPILVGPAIDFLVVTTAKSLVVASGVLLVVSGYGLTGHLGPWTTKASTDGASSGVVALALAFMVVYMYRDTHAELARPLPSGSGLARARARLQRWATRRNFVGPQHLR